MVDVSDDDLTDPEEFRALSHQAHLLREECSGLRETIDGALASLKGALKAHAAVSQQADILSRRIERAESKNAQLVAEKHRLQSEIEHLQAARPGE